MEGRILNDVLVPENLDTLPMLSFSKARFVAPKSVDVQDYCVMTQDQGNRPWCAAYAASAFASNVLWRKTGMPEVFDPEPIYRYAKRIDGSPDTDGTSLVAVMQALLHLKYFDENICSVKVLRTVDQVRFAIHKFGCCLLGLMVSKEWYLCNPSKTTITGNLKKGVVAELIGGHAVLCCGFDRNYVYIQNPWGKDWANHGFAYITWKELAREFSYGAVLNNCLYDMKMN